MKERKKHGKAFMKTGLFLAGCHPGSLLCCYRALSDHRDELRYCYGDC